MKKMYKTPEIDVLAIIGAQGLCSVSGFVSTNPDAGTIPPPQSDGR